MNPAADVWAKVLTLMQPEMTATTINTWFDDATAVALEDDRFVLYSPTRFKRDIIATRYVSKIQNALRELFSAEMDVVVLTEGELDQYQQPAQKNDFFPGTEEYTFERFVVGSSNKFAHAAARAVADNPGQSYNPLFIYGGVGLGKTHLMQAIGNYILSYAPTKKVVYVSCEKFTNEFIDAIQNQNNIDFRNKYRNVDILLIDDIQFLAGKDGTQEEFFHTFNALHEENKQIVISSDRPPKEIPKLEERLRSRFEMGLITDISAPNFETRIAILRKKAESYKEEIPNDVLSFIADSIHSNIRELEGALTTVVAYSKLHGEPICLETAKDALKDIFKAKENIVINSTYIKEMTAKYFNVTIEDIDSKKRTKAISLPRQVAMYLTRDLTDLSLPKIGEEFGGRDHSTVIHACQKINEEMEANTDFKNLIIRIQKEITGS